MDVGFDHGAVDAQLASLGYFQLLGQSHDVFKQSRQRFGLNEVRPADQRRVVRHFFQIHPTELPQDQAVTHPLLRLLIAPAIQVLDDQHPQDHFHRR